MRRILVLALACLMLLSAASLADQERHITFSATYVDRAATEIDAVYHYFCDQFNVDVEMIPVAWSAMSDMNSVMIMGGTMYDVMTIPNNYGTVLSYAEQELLKPLPEGWQQKYPNIDRAFRLAGIGEYFMVDGKTYAIPMLNFCNFINEDYCLAITDSYYRADWAKELGFDFGAVVTVSEFNDYLRACIDNDMAGNGQTIGLSSPYGATFYVNMHKGIDQLGAFVNTGDEYVWGPTVAGTVEGIMAAKQYYQEGLIDPDYYTLDAFAGQNKFAAGLAAATVQTLSVSNYQLIISGAETAGIQDAAQKMLPIVVTDDAGALHIQQVANFNWVKVFNPNLDDEAFDRILTMYDYFYTKEAELVYNMGLKGVDWDELADGSYVSYLSSEYEHIRIKYPSIWFWYNMAVFPEDFQLVNPSTDRKFLDPVNASINARYEITKEFGYTKLDSNIQFLDSEAMRNYSVDFDSEISRLVCDDNISMEAVEAEWNAFIQANAGIWQPVIDDLNALGE